MRQELIVDLWAKGEVLRPVDEEVVLGCNEGLGRCGLKACEVLLALFAPQFAVASGDGGGAGFRPDALGPAALGDHLVEERLGGGNAHEDVGELGAGGLAPNGDAVGIAAKGGDVVLNPFERGHEIAEGVVGGAVVFRARSSPEEAEVEKAKDSQAVRQGDGDDALAGELRSVMDWTEGMAADVASAVDPDEDRERAFAFRSPDVEVEAVFAMNEGLFAKGSAFAPLHRRGGEAGRVALAGPGFARNGRAKAERPDGRLGKRHAAEDIDA